MLAVPMMGRLGDASEITAVVDYCGAGGESQGLVEAGIRVVQAANHDEKAIDTHSANHRDTDHLLTDLLVQDPRRRPRAHIYQASPECTWHSPAGGRKKHRHREMLDMFDDYVPDAAGERSRATMMTVLGMAEAKRYPIVIVENVVEVADWEMFEVWLAGFTALGYDHQILSVSAAHIWSEKNAPAPQWRDRIYFVFYLHGIPFPDISPRPFGHCSDCGGDVRLIQSWKKPGRKIGKYRAQYVYACPVPGHPVIEPYVMPALDALDLSDLGTRIGDRKRPLAAATMRRIRVGALMFGGEPEVVSHTGHTYDATSPRHPRSGDPNAYHRVWPAADPLMARTSGPGDAIVHPYLTTVNHGGDDGRAFDPAASAMPTRSTKLGEAVVTPYMVQRRDYNGPDASRVTGVDAPMPTRTASDRGIHGLVAPEPFISHQYGAVKGSEHRNSDPATAPLGTITAGGGHHNLVTPPVGITLRKNARPYATDEQPTATMAAAGGHHGFISRQYTQKGDQGHLNTPLDAPLHTITASGGNHALVTPTKRPRIDATPEQIDAVDVSDYWFRMLQWREHANAQRFPRDYVFKGNSSVNTLHAGNAVAANVACYLGYMSRVALGDITLEDAGFEWLAAA
ncbi:DNA cytosine methyltransferase [Microbacterium sp. ZW T5_45]|uniref:DNA cytosine methyltransferase n=1 Tax=Microbacterium sp. ZW T5_45 TaxID=3378080 RepID=UPI0038547C51